LSEDAGVREVWRKSTDTLRRLSGNDITDRRTDVINVHNARGSA